METLDIIWNYVLPVGGGLTVGAIVSFIAVLCFKSFVNRLVGKLNLENLQDKAVEKGVEKVKHIAFTQTIQEPLESGLQKVNEMANEKVEKELASVNKKYDIIIGILTKFTAYFDNSIGIPQSVKDELHKELDKATSDKSSDIEIKVEQVVEESANDSQNGTQGVER